MTTIEYTAPPTCAKFMKSESFGRLIAGPVGSGKTTACLFELFRRACEQEPAEDGIRYTRFAIVRQTLKQLKDTVLKDILTWLDNVATYKVSDNTIYIQFGDVKSEWLLIPLDDMEDQRRLLSMQLTGAWLSECIEMDVGIISPLAGRCGRYPAANLGGATWFGLIADTNMPSEGSPWHTFMEVKTPPDWSIHIQPGGLESNAENLEWLTQTPETLKLDPEDPTRKAQGRTYYERFVRSNSPDWCKRYVHAKYGDDPSGSAVFRETFKRSWHVEEYVDPVPSYPLIVGLDFGRDPCAVICQPDHKGRLLVPRRSHRRRHRPRTTDPTRPAPGTATGALSGSRRRHRGRSGRCGQVYDVRGDVVRSGKARGLHGLPGPKQRHRQAHRRC
jgi:hypothetical protein